MLKRQRRRVLTRQDALQRGLKRYRGKVCAKHPNLKGEALALGVRVISSGPQNTAPARVFINDHRNISLVKEHVKLRLSFARAAMRVIERVG
jgi:hypothetical protein